MNTRRFNPLWKLPAATRSAARRASVWPTTALLMLLAVTGTGCGQTPSTGSAAVGGSGPAPSRSRMKPVPEGLFIYGASQQQIEFYVAQSMVNFPGMVEAIQASFVTPPQNLQLPAFQIQEFEVSNREYKAFLDATGYRTGDPANYLKVWSGTTYPDWAETFPVVWVSQADAAAFCAWRGGELPTEQQWEKAARGADGRYFPWGNVFPSEETANHRSPQAEPVGNRPGDESPYGVYDMGGNVAEWTQTVVEIDGGPKAIVRGGSFAMAAREMMVVHRDLGVSPQDRREDLGFRCVQR